ncbi:MAG: hypothetical protein JWM05_1188 [Acidimicrobiales bacterium]|nr:hypothetical protein [Acidimicrobiales bacterium]
MGFIIDVTAFDRPATEPAAPASDAWLQVGTAARQESEEALRLRVRELLGADAVVSDAGVALLQRGHRVALHDVA